jgi:hypothetical protein
MREDKKTKKRKKNSDLIRDEQEITKVFDSFFPSKYVHEAQKKASKE